MSTLNSEMIELPDITHPDAWEEPILFDEVETPDISATLLPEPFSSFAAALANETETAESLPVMTILGVLSAILAKRFTINPKDGWAEPINIYSLIALPPANNKSLVVNRCTAPLVQWEHEQEQQMQYEIKRCQSERKTQEKIIEMMRKKAASAKNSIEQQNLTMQITAAEVNLIEVPVLPKLFANDTTPEALVANVHEQGGRFAIFTDEGGILETLGGLYNNGNANIDILLKGIDGGELRVRRKDRSIDMNPYLTIVLAIQPTIIQTMSEKRSYIGNGALERFLYIIPKSKLGFRKHNTPSIPSSFIESYNRRINILLSGNHMIDSPRPLKLCENALNHWREFQRQIEIELRPDGRLIACQGWGGKICGFTLRIAGLLHVAQYGMDRDTIDDEVMEKAVLIAKMLVEHAIVAYGLMGCDLSVQDAKDVFYWITTNNKTSFTKTEILTAMRNRKLGKVERLNKAIDILISRNILSEAVQIPTKKPTIVHHVNPLISGARNANSKSLISRISEISEK